MAAHDVEERDAVKKEVLAEHRQLDVLLREVRVAFAGGGAESSPREAFARLREALETHFEQEDRLYYPSIWALRPSQREPLQACVAAHIGFRSMMRQIADLLEADEPGAALEVFDAFAQGFETHEALEESVLAALDRETTEQLPAARS